MPICKCRLCKGDDAPEEGFSIKNPKTGERFKLCDEGRKWNREIESRHRRSSGNWEKYHQNYNQKIRENVNSLLGSECYFSKLGECRNRVGYTLTGHEKRCNGHESEVKRILWADPSRASEFVHLCFRHHRDVHTVINLLGFSWDEIDALVEDKWMKQLQETT